MPQPASPQPDSPHPAPAAAARRALFPRGLAQPAGGFRFGADTLLLSAFAASSLPSAPARGAKPLTGLDLGTGCGAASLGLLLLRPDLDLTLLGLDSGPEMVDAAGENARALGLDGRFRAELADVQDFRQTLGRDSAWPWPTRPSARAARAGPARTRAATGHASRGRADSPPLQPAPPAA